MSDPYFRRIQADIRIRIASGEWPPGAQLPTTRELTEFYSARLPAPRLAPSTVRQAITLLIDSGELRGQQGVGVFVPDAVSPARGLPA